MEYEILEENVDFSDWNCLVRIGEEEYYFYNVSDTKICCNREVEYHWIVWAQERFYNQVGFDYLES